MDKALVFGTKDCRFESCQGHYCAGEPSGLTNHISHVAALLCTQKLFVQAASPAVVTAALDYTATAARHLGKLGLLSHETNCSVRLYRS